MHIHARVGHTEGPQVTDPKLPEWQTALEHHCDWWKKIILPGTKGHSVFHYYSRIWPGAIYDAPSRNKKPLANQWEINVWMMNYLKAQLNA